MNSGLVINTQITELTCSAKNDEFACVQFCPTHLSELSVNQRAIHLQWSFLKPYSGRGRGAIVPALSLGFYNFFHQQANPTKLGYFS